MTVTYSRKCYLFVCAGCGGLCDSQRADQVTCSPACRVAAHRSGKAQELRTLAASLELKPASIQHAAAIQALRPDLENQILCGDLNLYQAMQLCRPAFNDAVLSSLNERTQP
jgi:hypothetical protein